MRLLGQSLGAHTIFVATMEVEEVLQKGIDRQMCRLLLQDPAHVLIVLFQLALLGSVLLIIAFAAGLHRFLVKEAEGLPLLL